VLARPIAFYLPQYHPIPVEVQVAVIWAVQNGFVDDVSVERVKEFQTGLRGRSRGLAAIHSFATLQQRFGRRLHPLIIDGVAYTTDLTPHFERITFADSQPFMKAMHRRRQDWIATSVLPQAHS